MHPVNRYRSPHVATSGAVELAPLRLLRSWWLSASAVEANLKLINVKFFTHFLHSKTYNMSIDLINNWLCARA